MRFADQRLRTPGRTAFRGVARAEEVEKLSKFWPLGGSILIPSGGLKHYGFRG